MDGGETVGKFEFSRKDLIGHGAFAVVFKGRHKEKPELEVAVKCINKKNLAKSQTLLGKEIKILKELKHENIVALYDFQVSTFNYILVLSMRTLSEDTIRLFLQQIAGAMKMLHSKGIIHRDLKPQNILLSYAGGRKSNPNNIRIKIADFGFARYLQNNMMAATLCGSPMYMAPEVIMSQHYDAKADLWSIGTIIYQCLTGKAPFQASSPQDLRLFYEKNKMLMPNSGSGSSSSSSSTSHLASPPSLGEMQQQLQEKALASPTQDSPGFLHGSKDSAGSSSKNSSCDTDDFVMVPAQFSSKLASGNCRRSEGRGMSSLVTSAGLESQGRTPSPSPPYSSSSSPSSRPGQFSSSKYGHSVPIPVPTQIHNYRRIEQNLQSPHQYASPRQTVIPSSLGAEVRSRIPAAGASAPEHSPRGMGSRLHSAPNLSDLHSCRQKITKQHSDPLVAQFGHTPVSQPLQIHGLQHCRQLRSSPKLSEFMQRSPLPTIMGSPTKAVSPFEFPKTPSSQNLLTLLAHQGVMMTPTRNKTLPDLKEMGHFHCQQTGLGLRPVEEIKGRSLSTGRLTDLLLKAAFGAQISEAGSNDSLNNEKPMEIAAPSGAYGGTLHSGARAGGSASPSPVIFTVGSPPSGTTPPQTTRTRMFSALGKGSQSSFTGRHLAVGTGGDALEGPSSLRYAFADPITANLEGAVTFEAPELPEETLMEQEHTDILRSLRFTLAFVHYVMEIAALKGSSSEMSGSVASEYQLQESVVADQISLLSREWSYAEQLVLYLKVAELLSSGLQTAIEQIKAGKLCLSSTVKQVVKKLNELYKSSVSSCHCLNMRLQRFFLDKQKLMDQINSITAEKLIFSYAVQMVQSAALDEMFHHREDCAQRYHKALLLMEGLLNIITEQGDIENINKCECSGTFFSHQVMSCCSSCMDWKF
uniref:non-specific serine/threonine protein kinase n=1 Tax=Pavo cristatus TaxID=9049 RepID=A0A8C9FA39_PAVCR